MTMMPGEDPERSLRSQLSGVDGAESMLLFGLIPFRDEPLPGAVMDTVGSWATSPRPYTPTERASPPSLRPTAGRLPRHPDTAQSTGPRAPRTVCFLMAPIRLARFWSEADATGWARMRCRRVHNGRTEGNAHRKIHYHRSPPRAGSAATLRPRHPLRIHRSHSWVGRGPDQREAKEGGIIS